MQKMIELKNINFKVKDTNSDTEKTIIDNLSLTIDSGKLVVITGPNGGGKSSLAKIIMGIENAQSGKIIFEGQDITNYNISDRSKLGICYGFQQPARFKGMTIKKLLDIAAGKRLPMLSCNEYLSKVGLCSAGYLTREIDKSLSGGEIKRIEIATVLAKNPKLSIYDEPEAGIDLWSFDRLTQTFKTIHQQNKNKTIIIISHQERILELADEIILLDSGKIKTIGAPKEILPNLGFVHKNMPECQLSSPTQLHGSKIPTTC